jgi:PAS domain S-box-containing protein
MQTKENSTTKNSILTGTSGLIMLLTLLFAVFATLEHDFLHFFAIGLLELAAIFLAFIIFVVTWFTRKYFNNSPILLIGISFLFVSILDLFSFIALGTFGISPAIDLVTAGQFWISSRIISSITFLIAPFFSNKELKLRRIFLVYTLTFLFMALSIYVFNIFPEFYRRDIAIALPEVITGLVTAIIMLSSVITFYSRKKDFEPSLFRILITVPILISIAILIATFNVNPWAFEYMLSYYLVFAAKYILFVAIVQNGLERPYDFLYKNLEESAGIREQRDFLETIMRTAPAAIMVLDKNLKISRLNLLLENITGLKEEKVRGKNWQLLPVPSKDKKLLEEIFLMTLQGKPYNEIHTHLNAKKGERRDFQWYTRTIRDNGSVAGLLAVGLDVTERTKTIRELEESEEKYRQLFTAELDAVLVYDEISLLITDVNDAAVELYGYSKSEFMNLEISEIFAGKNQLPDDVPRDSETETLKYHKKKNGQVFLAEISKGSFRLKGRKMTCEIVRDQTESENLKNALIQKNKELESFAYKVSHDLKSPLTTVRGYLNLLEKNPSRIDMVIDAVNDEFTNMFGFIDSVLKLSRAGRVIDVKEDAELAEIAREAYMVVKPEDIKVRIDCEDLPIVSVDRDRMVQVFVSFFKNSIEHHDPSKDELVIEIGSRRDNRKLTVWFKDNGMGIKKEIQDKIFETGFTYRTAGQRGTGLGLAIVKKIIEAHGGRVWVESPGENMGATFFFELPVESRKTN